MTKSNLINVGSIIIFVLLFLPSAPTQAATMTAGDATSLIAAINAANANSDFDTILLTNNISLNAVNNMTNGPNGLPPINYNLEIDGQGFSISRAGGSLNFRFFYINLGAGPSLTLKNMTLSGGSVVGGGAINGAGGAIYNEYYLVVSNVIFDNNSADYGGALKTGDLDNIHNAVFTNNTADYGGAINGDALISNSLFSGNHAFNEGGAILGAGTLLNTTITNNTSDIVAGGIWVDGTFDLYDCVISNNFASSAGGIGNFGVVNLINSTVSGNQSTSSGGGGILSFGTLTIFNTTISNNTAFSEGGGLHNEATATLTNTTIMNNTGGTFGGGVWNGFGGQLTLTNSTVSGNAAGSDGGGIINFGFLRPTNTTITDNTATGDGGGIFNDDFSGTTVANNTIIAGNTAANFLNCAGTFAGIGTNNLSENIANDGCNASFGDITPGTDFSLTLANNGAPTQTHALLNSVGNPALDASNATAPEVDQRGVPIQGAGRDIGAYEFGVDPTYPTIAFTSTGEIYPEADYVTIPIELTITGGSNFADIAEVYVVDTYTGTATSENSTAPEGDYGVVPDLQIVIIDCTSGTCPTSATVEFVVRLDAILEGPETAIFAIVGSNGFVQIGSPAEFVATIIDSATVTITANDPNAVENPTDNGQFTVDMGMPNFTGNPITVNYSIGGTATNGTDYATLSGSVDIPDGVQTATIDVLPIDDTLLEGAETVTLTLTNTNVQYVLVDTIPATVTIQDDEAPTQTGNFEVSLSKTGAFASGEVGLVGDTIIWTITATNVSQVSASDVVVTDIFMPELQIDDVTTTQGSVAVSGQTVTVSVGTLNSDETVTITVTTTIISLPSSGQFTNTVTLTGAGQSFSASTVISGVNGLPSTGYPPRLHW